MLRPVTSISAALTAQEERERHQRALAIEVKALQRELAEARAQIQALQGDANKITSWSIDRKNYRATPFLMASLALRWICDPCSSNFISRLATSAREHAWALTGRCQGEWVSRFLSDAECPRLERRPD